MKIYTSGTLCKNIAAAKLKPNLKSFNVDKYTENPYDNYSNNFWNS